MSAPRMAAGAALLLLAMAGFAVSDALAKQLGGALSAWQLAGVRYLALLATVLPFALLQAGAWRSRSPGLQLLRAAALVGSAVLFLRGLQALPVAEATAMVFASPLFVTLLAALVLRERVAAVRWLPVVLGFAGVLVVVRPGGLHYGGAELFPLLSSLAWAVAVVCTRRLGSIDALPTTMLYAAVAGSAGTAWALPQLAATQWQGHALLLAGMALAWCAAQWLTVAAYRAAPPSAIAPLAYSQLAWAGLLGYAAFGHVPDGASLAGMALIMASGLLAAWLARRA